MIYSRNNPSVPSSLIHTALSLLFLYSLSPVLSLVSQLSCCLVLFLSVLFYSVLFRNEPLVYDILRLKWNLLSNGYIVLLSLMIQEKFLLLINSSVFVLLLLVLIFY